MLFWASFFALAVAGFGFAFRVMLPDVWSDEFKITAEEVGRITGAALWPIAITMVVFSLIIDKIGYKSSMMLALLSQGLSVVLTILAKDTNTLWWACFSAGLGHGIVEAVINPLCATMFRHEKSKMLNILHAAWPAGIVAGGALYLVVIEVNPEFSWRLIFLLMILPMVAYGVLFLICQSYPVDERVEADISNIDMLRELGGLGAFMATSFIFYELVNQLCHSLDTVGGQFHNHLLQNSLVVGAIIGFIFGYTVRSKGQLLFFFLCLVMIPLATAELATDHWIKSLMTPVLAGEYNIDAGWAIVASAFIMMVLRFFAGIPLKYMSPPALLLASSVCSIAGLYMLSGATGIAIFVAFVFYAVGQSFYWPTILGLVSERFPKGGAMTLNTLSAMGLLTVGIFGFPFLGAVKDSYDARAVKASDEILFEKYKIENRKFIGVKYDSIKTNEVLGDPILPDKPALKIALQSNFEQSVRKTLLVAAILPLIMAFAFLAILIGFKIHGGYRPVILSVESNLVDRPGTIADHGKATIKKVSSRTKKV